MITMLQTVGGFVSGATYNLSQTVEIDYINRGYARLATQTEAIAEFGDETGDIRIDAALGNTDIGIGAGGANTLGGNVAIGPYAFGSAVQVNDSVAIGSEAGRSQTSCVGNVYIGRLSGYSNLTSGNNTAIGDSTLRDNLAVGNTAIGYVAGQAITTGAGNVVIGSGVANVMTTGAQNVAVGTSSMIANVEGSRNVVIGYTAGNAATGNDMIAIGHQALYNATRLSAGNATNENVGIGSNAGFQVTTGIRNTFVGANAGNSASQLVTAVGSTALGNGAFTTKDYQMVLGGSTQTECVIRGAVVFPSIPASVTPASNGEIVLQQTSNTSLTFKLKGSDGTVRSASLTLS